ncbi:hypothetical protein BDF14DRAFT_1752300 [Spinellus fusiger]|nr:hypothetical protein BDF14DRAFT_1752300 [Spinellus fusiger]
MAATERQKPTSYDQQWVSLSALVDDPTQGVQDTEDMADTITHNLKQQLYLLLEAPSSSRAAFWTNVVVSLLIVLSAVMTTLETIPAFRSADSDRLWFHLEVAMVSLFSLEYILRIFAHSDSLKMIKHFFLCKAPLRNRERKKERTTDTKEKGPMGSVGGCLVGCCFYYKAPLSIIDFISIIPFYIELLAKRDTTHEFRFTILRLFRLLRLFKTYKYSNTIIMTIEVLVAAMHRSSDALYALLFFLVTCVVLFSTLLYFAERGVWDSTLETFVNPDGKPSAFDSIPAAFWFVMVTITTTGYGDMVPATFIGKLVTFPAMMFGVLVNTLHLHLMLVLSDVCSICS